MRLVPFAIIFVGTCAAAAPTEVPFSHAQGVPLKVAFVVSEGTTLIDVAGPMTVFEDVPSPGKTDAFDIYTVSETRKPVQIGNFMMVPEFTFADAPEPDIVVEAAQTGGSAPYLNYLRSMNSSGRLMLSVCTGASKFAQAGMLDGLEATTHHTRLEAFQARFPKVHFIPNKAWVHSAPNIYTAGGESSGIELALHIVELYFSHDVALQAARQMEYRGPDWQH
jgi:transcriptional regulator GlxA family with amidase domain